jgi:hypothetical protein
MLRQSEGDGMIDKHGKESCDQCGQPIFGAHMRLVREGEAMSCDERGVSELCGWKCLVQLVAKADAIAK